MASIQSNCSLIQHIAGDIVSEGWVTWKTYANDAIIATEGFFEELKAIPLTPIQTDIQFEIPPDLGVPFTKPLPPQEPELGFRQVDSPGGIVIPPTPVPDFGVPPVLDATPPVIVTPISPGDLTAVPPEGPPDSAPITIPDAPIIILPAEPTLEDITLPAVPSITLPEFDADRPTLDIQPPNGALTFIYEDYASQIPGLVVKINGMLAGGTGLPDAIWDALWERARDREQATGDKLIQEMTDDWASRGFSLPGGVLDKKIVAARQDVQNAQNTLSRDIAVKQADMEVENIRFAVAQGIAFENMYIGLHNEKMRVELDIAKSAIEISISIFNAEVSYQNIQLQTYLADVQVFRLLIESEMANIELYKAQLEGQKLVGDINQQSITLYNSTIQSLLSQIEIYKGELEGVNALVAVNRNEIDAFTAQVQSFSAQVAAKDSEVKLFAERVSAEESKANVYETEVNAFASLVGAYKSGNDALISQARLDLENNSFSLEQHKTRVAQFATEVDAESKRISAGVDVFNGQAQMYTAELGAEQARIIADSRQFDLSIQQGRIQTDVELKEADLNIQQLLRLMTLDIDKTKTVLTVQAQLAAAAMTAVNLSASVSEAAANSTSCSTSTTTEI